MHPAYTRNSAHNIEDARRPGNDIVILLNNYVLGGGLISNMIDLLGRGTENL